MNSIKNCSEMMDEKSRLFEFRIKYNAGPEHSAMDNYHYYMAETAELAYDFHLIAMRTKGKTCQNVSVDRFNPWSEKWEDVSEVLDHKEVSLNENYFS